MLNKCKCIEDKELYLLVRVSRSKFHYRCFSLELDCIKNPY